VHSCLAELKGFVAFRHTDMTHNLRHQASTRPSDNGTHEHEVAGSQPATVSSDPADHARRTKSNTRGQDSVEPPSLRTPGGSESKETLEPLTISLPSPLVRQARIVVVALGTTMSKLVTGLLEEAVARELPAIVAELSGARRTAK